MNAAAKKISAANDSRTTAPRSQEVVIALIGYAGAGCTEVSDKLQINLHKKGYETKVIKLSKIIETLSSTDSLPKIRPEAQFKGIDKLARACTLQDLGDKFRSELRPDILVRKSLDEIISERKGRQVGESKIAFILDSVKHVEEVNFLKDLYGASFRLLAVHSSRPRREKRLSGDAASSAKFAGARPEQVMNFMKRDEKNIGKKDFGQQVRDAFYLADYFLDNDNDDQEKIKLNDDIDRFSDLLLGKRLFRPTREESGIYQAFAASRHSACLSRQVGAALYSQGNRLLSDGANEVPKFNGGVYGDEDGTPEKRCFGWSFSENGSPVFTGCHNTRKKHAIRNEIAEWMSTSFADTLAKKLTENNVDNFNGEDFKSFLKKGVELSNSELEKAPGIGQLIEFSRSIHAEMDAVLTAAREGISTVGTTLYCTTYPCHNCARHLVTAGVYKVVYVEPYVKSLALELHSDSITVEKEKSEELDTQTNKKKQVKLLIKAFTGVGPRMFDIHFKKTLELKNTDGSYNEPSGGVPIDAVRIDRLEDNEKKAIEKATQ